MKKLFRLLGAIAALGVIAPAYAQYNPVLVQKAAGNKIYAHLMPWFESKEYSGYWGIHWTMANKNPDSIDASGRRQIAAHYYPLIGPYASGDPDLVEYQLLLMKLSGIDGVLIDWPGTTNAFDYVRNRQNSEAVINKINQVGLQFAVVYEDHNLALANVGDKLAQGRNDMAYLRDNYFNKSSHINVNGRPLLLTFGPQTFQNANDWTNVFSVLPTKPYFLTLWYEHVEAGANGQGEYSWIYQDGNSYLNHLTNFYQNATNYGMKMGAAAPGFNAYYAEGGWGANPFVINHNGTTTFKSTLDLALNNGIQHIQLATWNDYGEGSMIEPTREFGYGFLTYLQQRLGVSGLGQAELELVHELYQQRKTHKGNANEQTRLNNVFGYLVSLQTSAARNLLNGTSPVNNIQIEAEHYAVMNGVQTESCAEGGRNIGWIDAGDWMVWDINLPSNGTYRVEYRVAGLNGGSIRLERAGANPIYGTINVPVTGGWQNWQTIAHTVNLTAGQQQIAIYAPEGGYNINWIKFTKL